MKIAYLEDDEAQAQYIGELLVSNAHECHAFSDGSQLIGRLKRDAFDMLLLDWQVPGITGHQVTLWARANLSRRVPIIFMASRSLEEDIVEALNAGADDYMIKPIRRAELIARIEALARRVTLRSTSNPEPIVVANYRIDPRTRACFVSGQPVELTSREFDLALMMFQYVGRVLSREHIGATIWGQLPSAISRTLDTHISRVRAKLQLRPENGVRLTPVYGHGYRLDLIGEPADPADC
ncbi:MAG TPA: response regulator transcription factor [Trinickia sp.]|uniref:response regulator transcription factor n=1 Tax=Trinickia sp. TaxID=2571163 RepID=UPI002CAEED60|nr:response regulator transcription factor [Trinickia sp.]HTI19043.1 response regulator transcription factor [Trinickia sp.]